MSEEYDKMSDAEKKKEDWMNSKWRPMMGWSYMATCICDFVLFPVLWSILQAFMHVTQITQWQPLTLQGAGLYHLAMGAVLGIAALGRTQEKIAGANNGGANTSPSGFAAPSAPSAGFGAPASGFGAPAAAPAAPSGFGASSFGSAPKPVAAPTAVGFSSTGKPMPAPAPEPEL